MVTLAQASLCPSPGSLSLLVEKFQVVIADIVITIYDKECTEQQKKGKFCILHIYVK